MVAKESRTGYFRLFESVESAREWLLPQHLADFLPEMFLGESPRAHGQVPRNDARLISLELLDGRLKTHLGGFVTEKPINGSLAISRTPPRPARSPVSRLQVPQP